MASIAVFTAAITVGPPWLVGPGSLGATGLSSTAVRVDGYFDSEQAAERLFRVLESSHGSVSQEAVEAFGERGFGPTEVLGGWLNFHARRRGNKITLQFDTVVRDWEDALAGFLAGQGAKHVLFDLFDDKAGVESELGYIDGKRTPIARMVKALRAVDPALALHEAIRRQRTAQVKRLLADGADPNARRPGDAAKVPAVVLAVEAKSPGILAMILKAGGAVDGARPDSGETALHRCTRFGERELRVEIATLLLAQGADPNGRDDEGFTPLQRAAAAGQPDLCELFLRHGGDADSRLDDGRTLAMIAAGAANDGLGVLRVLAAHGADLTATDGNGRDVFFHALPRVALEEYLLSRGVERYVPEGEYSGDVVPDLFTAIRFDHVDKADALVRDETVANASFNPGTPTVFLTALHRATETGRREIVEILLARGADPDVLGGYGPPHTALRKAAWNGDQRIVAALIGAGADLEATSDNSEPPLMTAATRGHFEIVRLLLDAGADPAAEFRGVGVLETLLIVADGGAESSALVDELTARVELDDEARYRLLEKAIHRGNRWLQRQLAEEGLAIRESDLAQAVGRNDIESFHLLLPFYEANRSSGGEVRRDGTRIAPLVVCCLELVKSKPGSQARQDQRRIFAALLAAGIDLEAPRGHETALVALQKKKGFVEETSMLCEAGAAVNRLVPDYLGGSFNGEFSALQVAAYHGLVENCRVLVAAGAECDLAEGSGAHGTALRIARTRHKKKVVALLRELGGE